MKLPDGWHSVTPRIVTEDVTGLVEFLRRAFNATGEVHPDRPAVMRIADSHLMISEAVEAGARSLEQPIDTPYGDRRGMVEDRWGNVWQIATFRG